jgi:hypothetical protein
MSDMRISSSGGSVESSQRSPEEECPAQQGTEAPREDTAAQEAERAAREAEARAEAARRQAEAARLQAEEALRRGQEEAAQRAQTQARTLAAEAERQTRQARELRTLAQNLTAVSQSGSFNGATDFTPAAGNGVKQMPKLDGGALPSPVRNADAPTLRLTDLMASLRSGGRTAGAGSEGGAFRAMSTPGTGGVSATSLPPGTPSLTRFPVEFVDKTGVQNASPAERRADISKWQNYANQWSPEANAEINRKRGISPKAEPELTSPELRNLVRDGKPHNGPYPGGWMESDPDRPVFVDDFPNSENRQLQLYSFPRANPETGRKEWVSFDVSGDILKAYNSDPFTGNKQGTNSVLGFPNSGREPMTAEAAQTFFNNDPKIKNLLDQGKPVAYQNFENGFLVDLGNGRVQAYSKNKETRTADKPLGTEFPKGGMTATPMPGTNATGSFSTVFSSFDLAPGVTLPSRVGAHWGTLDDYSHLVQLDGNGNIASQDARLTHVLDEMKKAGLGYSTVIVDATHPEKQEGLLKAMMQAGIQPVIRLRPGDGPTESGLQNQTGYDRTMNDLGPKDLEALAAGAAKLQSYGVKAIQLDNEPNVDEGGKRLFDVIAKGAEAAEGTPERKAYTAAMDKYGSNLATAMQKINQAAPGMAIGFGTVVVGNPTETSGKIFFTDLMSKLKNADNPAGSLMKNAWLGIHPYSAGAPGSGLPAQDWFINEARKSFPNIKALATEGGTRYQDWSGKPTGQQDHSGVNQTMMRQMNDNPEYTQCFWIIAGKYLGSGDGWEKDAIIREDGKALLFLEEAQNIAAGKKAD